MKSKSQASYKAGQILQQNNFFNSTIHCFYYSCIQLMIYILLKKNGLSEEEIDQNARASKKGFHNWLINQILLMYQNVNYNNSRDFNEKIQSLKKLRVQADYKLFTVYRRTSNWAKKCSNNVNNLLEKDFLS